MVDVVTMKKRLDVKVEREARGWSQQDLAKMAQISRRTVQRAEEGRELSLLVKMALTRVFAS